MKILNFQIKRFITVLFNKRNCIAMFESFPASQECKDRSAPMPASVVRK